MTAARPLTPAGGHCWFLGGECVAAQMDTIEHRSFAGPDRKCGSGFDPSVVEDVAVAGIYVCRR